MSARKAFTSSEEFKFMPPTTNKTDEYRGLNDAQQKAIKEYRSAKDIALDYCRPYFDKFVRFDRLMRGALPEELDGTYSKIMLQIAYAMVENELPRSLRGVLSTSKWFNVRALAPEYELMSDPTNDFLKYQMEYVQRYARSVIPSVQQAHAFGTGYRVYGHRTISKKVKDRVPSGFVMGYPIGFHDEIRPVQRTIVTGEPVGIFDVWPLPGGPFINDFDESSGACCDGLVWHDYRTEDQIKQFMEDGVFDREQCRQLLAMKTPAPDPAAEYKQQTSDGNTGSGFQPLPEWIRLMRTKEGLPKRFRLSWYFRRDKWIVVGEDKYVLYNDIPLMECIPIAKFMSSYDQMNFFGKGLIEITEDLILATLLLMCNRFDYLAGTLHPPTWVRESILEHLGGDKSLLDPGPYGIIPFPNNVSDIRTAQFRDRFPDISNQAFIEDEKLNLWMQKIAGQPDYQRGVTGSSGAAMNETSSGIHTLIGEGTARSMMRACTIEETGITDSLYITLKLCSQFYIGDQAVRSNKTPGAWPWESVDWEAIRDGYAIEVTGSRDFTMMEQTFRRMIETSNMLLAIAGVYGPQVIEDPKELSRQILENANAFRDIDKIIGNPVSSNSTPVNAMTAQIPGQPSSNVPFPLAGLPPSMGPLGQTQMGNEMRSVAGAQQNGAAIAAGNMPV